MAGIAHLFNFNQSLHRKKLLTADKKQQHKDDSQGLEEASRHNKKLQQQRQQPTMMRSCTNVGNINQFSSATTMACSSSNNKYYSAAVPSVVARLMGLELDPTFMAKSSAINDAAPQQQMKSDEMRMSSSAPCNYSIRRGSQNDGYTLSSSSSSSSSNSWSGSRSTSTSSSKDSCKAEGAGELFGQGIGGRFYGGKTAAAEWGGGEQQRHGDGCCRWRSRDEETMYSRDVNSSRRCEGRSGMRCSSSSCSRSVSSRRRMEEIWGAEMEEEEELVEDAMAFLQANQDYFRKYLINPNYYGRPHNYSGHPDSSTTPVLSTDKKQQQRRSSAAAQDVELQLQHDDRRRRQSSASLQQGKKCSCSINELRQHHHHSKSWSSSKSEPRLYSQEEERRRRRRMDCRSACRERMMQEYIDHECMHGHSRDNKNGMKKSKKNGGSRAAGGGGGGSPLKSRIVVLAPAAALIFSNWNKKSSSSKKMKNHNYEYNCRDGGSSSSAAADHHHHLPHQLSDMLHASASASSSSNNNNNTELHLKPWPCHHHRLLHTLTFLHTFTPKQKQSIATQTKPCCTCSHHPHPHHDCSTTIQSHVSTTSSCSNSLQNPPNHMNSNRDAAPSNFNYSHSHHHNHNWFAHYMDSINNRPILEEEEELDSHGQHGLMELQEWKHLQQQHESGAVEIDISSNYNGGRSSNSIHSSQPAHSNSKDTADSSSEEEYLSTSIDREEDNISSLEEAAAAADLDITSCPSSEAAAADLDITSCPSSAAAAADLDITSCPSSAAATALPPTTNVKDANRMLSYGGQQEQAHYGVENHEEEEEEDQVMKKSNSFCKISPSGDQSMSSTTTTTSHVDLQHQIHPPPKHLTSLRLESEEQSNPNKEACHIHEKVNQAHHDQLQIISNIVYPADRFRKHANEEDYDILIDGIECPEGTKSILLYVKDLLVTSGFITGGINAATAANISTRCHLLRMLSSNQPLTIDQYSISKPITMVQKKHSEIAAERASICMQEFEPEGRLGNRLLTSRLLLDRINEVLCEILAPYYMNWPWSRPYQKAITSDTTLINPITGRDMVSSAVWDGVCEVLGSSQGQLQQPLEKLVSNELVHKDQCWGQNNLYNIQKLVSQIEETIFNDIIQEMISTF